MKRIIDWLLARVWRRRRPIGKKFRSDRGRTR